MTKQNRVPKKESEYDVVIVGAGAAGIGCGMVLQDLEVERFIILDRHEVGASFRRWPEETRLLTPSFTINGFGMPDLNSIALQTSPAYTLHTEHPTGPQYAAYLEAIADHFKLPVQCGIDVMDVQPHLNQQGFTLQTSGGTIDCRYLIWAAGEFQYPNLTPFPGAELCRHYATVPSWRKLPDDAYVVIGGYESGMDTAVNLARAGRRVTVLDPTAPWGGDAADPSLSLSPFTRDRLRRAKKQNLIEFVSAEVETVTQTSDDRYHVNLSNGEKLLSNQPPILATGFNGSLQQIAHLFEWGEIGSPIVTKEADESTITPRLFLSGPMLRHGNVIFCFIYKFRQRFAVIGNAIAEQLGLDTNVLEEYYAAQMYLDDLSCCDVSCAC